MEPAPMIAVTGAGGFVGRAVCADLRAHDVPVRAIGRSTDRGMVAIGDIGPGTDWGSALAGCRAIVHLAARVHVMRDGSRDPLSEFRRVNVDGTMALAEQAAASGIERLIFVSSIKVNGEVTSPGHPFAADHEPAPQDPYGISKFEAERALRALSRRTGMAVVIIRPPLIYGAGVRANFGALVRAVAAGVPLPFGAVRNSRSLLAVDNLADLIRRCLDHSAAPGAPLLASDGEDLSTPDLLIALARSLGRPARLLRVPVPVLQSVAALAGRRAVIDRLIQSLEVDSGATRRRLGWTPPFTVAQAFTRAAAAGWLSPSQT